MKRLAALLIALILLTPLAVAPAFAADEAPMSAAEVFDLCVKSTVYIESANGGGSGFFIEEDIIVTNNHVISEEGWRTVRTYDGQVFNVTEILAHSESPDLAILRIDGKGTPVKFSERPLREGEDIYCLGAPMGIYPCISDGIVMKRTYTDNGVDYILSNFHSIGGNSGGPVFNAYGEVVGVCVGGMVSGPNSIDMVIDAKYVHTMEMHEPKHVQSKEEWLVWISLPEEDHYEHASLQEAKVGQLVTFGRYEQDSADAQTEDIFWIVTDRSGDTLTLLSLYCLDVVPYHTDSVDVTWETSYVRSFLNGEFYTKAFNADEQSRILESRIVNSDNVLHGTEGGNDTVDKVYLMSLEEAMDFYDIADPVETFYSDVYAPATQYTMSKGVWLEIADSNRCWWWLRSPGGNPQNAAEIGSAGYLSFNGSMVISSERAIRPVIRVKVK